MSSRESSCIIRVLILAGLLHYCGVSIEVIRFVYVKHSEGRAYVQ